MHHLPPDTNHTQHRVVTKGRDGSVSVWTIEQSKWTKISSVECGSVGFCVASVCKFGGRTLVATTTDSQCEVAVRDVETGVTAAVVGSSGTPSASGMCTAVKLVELSARLTLLTGHEDGSVALWDKTTNQDRSRITPHQEPVLALDYSSMLNKGFSVSADNQICAWIVDTDKWTMTQSTKIDLPNQGLNCVVFRPDDKLFVTGGWDNVVRVFEAKKGKPLALLKYHSDSIQCLAFHDDKTLAVGSKDGLCSIWSVYKHSNKK